MSPEPNPDPQLILSADAKSNLLPDGCACPAYVEGHHCWERCPEPFAGLLGLPEGARGQRQMDPEAGPASREGGHAVTAPRPILTDRSYAWLALAYLAFAVYGSLLPFHFRPLPLDEAAARFRAACQQPIRVESRSDWVTNVLLTIPLAFCLMGALGVDRPRRGWPGDALLVLPCCAAASTAIEFAQIFFPPRVSSLNDIVAQVSGAGVGVLAWVAWGQRGTLWVRRFWSGPDVSGIAARLLPPYLALLLLVHVVPLDLTLSPADLYRKYRQGRILLLPFSHPGDSLLDTARKTLLNGACFLPGGLLLAGLPQRVWRGQGSWLLAWGLGLGLAGFIETCQLFVYSRYVDATDVVTGSLAVLLGWVCGRSFGPCWSGTRQDAPDPGARALRRGLLVGWVAVLAFLTWEPFDCSPGLALSRLRDLSLIPFADTFRGNYLTALEQLVQKFVLFIPLGVLLAPAGDAAGRPGRRWPGVVTAVLLAGGLEVGQLFLPSRSASIGDVLVEALGACVGLAVCSRIRQTT